MRDRITPRPNVRGRGWGMRRRGRSIIEVVAVLAVIALLVGLSLPAVLGSRKAADRVPKQNDTRQREVEAEMTP